MVQSNAGKIPVIPIVCCCYANLIRDEKVTFTWSIVFVTSVQVVKLVVTFEVILCLNKHLFQFSVFFCENSMLRCHRLAILPPSGSYDPELPSVTRQIIVYLAFRQPFPLHSHALCTSVTHSSHLYNNFLLLYLLVQPALGPVLDYISLVWTDLRSASFRLFRSPAPGQSSVCFEQPYASVLQVVLSLFS